METMTSFVIKKTFIVLALLSIQNAWSAAVEEQTIVAAYSFGRALYMLNENMTNFIFDNTGLRLFVVAERDTIYPMESINEPFSLQAVVRTLGYGYLVYTDRFGVFAKLGKNDDGAFFRQFRRLNYGPRRKFIRHGGPDAAVRKDGSIFVFKGCKMAIRVAWDKWTKPMDVRDINLPCDVDAAWKLDDKAILLKGDQVWTWGPRNQVSGPVKFCDMYHCKGEFALKAKSQM